MKRIAREIYSFRILHIIQWSLLLSFFFFSLRNHDECLPTEWFLERCKNNRKFVYDSLICWWPITHRSWNLHIQWDKNRISESQCNGQSYFYFSFFQNIFFTRYLAEYVLYRLMKKSCEYIYPRGILCGLFFDYTFTSHESPLPSTSIFIWKFAVL